MIDVRCRRVPAYVHSPKTIREIVRSLKTFDDKKRQALFRRAHSLLFEPKNRLEKCIRYAEDISMTKKVFRCALSSLRNRTHGELMHWGDQDSAIELLLTLRWYTFELAPSEIIRLSNEIGFKHELTLEFIRKNAIKIFKGITPKKHSIGVNWKENIIDEWIEEAEKESD